MRYLAPLAAAAALLIGGAYSYASQQTVPGTALLAGGLIVLGAWIALEAAGLIQARPARKDPER
jgi:hypothetical protein